MRVLRSFVQSEVSSAAFGLWATASLRQAFPQGPELVLSGRPKPEMGGEEQGTVQRRQSFYQVSGAVTCFVYKLQILGLGMVAMSFIFFRSS